MVKHKKQMRPHEIERISKYIFKIRSSIKTNKVFYYITLHSCPECDHVIPTCSCPSFQMGKMKAKVDAFHDPCVHIKKLNLITWKRWRVGARKRFEDLKKSPRKSLS